jgi:hypothetical protein
VRGVKFESLAAQLTASGRLVQCSAGGGCIAAHLQCPSSSRLRCGAQLIFLRQGEPLHCNPRVSLSTQGKAVHRPPEISSTSHRRPCVYLPTRPCCVALSITLIPDQCPSIHVVLCKRDGSLSTNHPVRASHALPTGHDSHEATTKNKLRHARPARARPTNDNRRPAGHVSGTFPPASSSSSASTGVRSSLAVLIGRPVTPKRGLMA